MNIYSHRGAKVRFAYPNNGYEHDRQDAAKHLTVDQVYTVERTEVHSFHTSVWLQEVPGVAFNSVLFENEPIS